MLITAVGRESEWGKTMALVQGESPETPLQISLGSLAAAIGKVGLAVGGLCFIVLMIRYMYPLYVYTWLTFHVACLRRLLNSSISLACSSSAEAPGNWKGKTLCRFPLLHEKRVQRLEKSTVTDIDIQSNVQN